MRGKNVIFIRKYVKSHGIDLSTFIRRAAIEKIEDGCDLTLFNNVWEEEKKELKTHNELEKELNL